jgi:hypothetical protein
MGIVKGEKHTKKRSETVGLHRGAGGTPAALDTRQHEFIPFVFVEFVLFLGHIKVVESACRRGFGFPPTLKLQTRMGIVDPLHPVWSCHPVNEL